MDGLSAAASVIAVIDIAAKVASLCFQYSAAVKDAKEDIERLQRKIVYIRDILSELKRLLDGQDKTRLSATDKLAASLKDRAAARARDTAEAREDSQSYEPIRRTSSEIAF